MRVQRWETARKRSSIFRSERRIARDVIHEWNAVNSKSQNTVLQPVGWETHASPAMGDRPQEILNLQIGKKNRPRCDPRMECRKFKIAKHRATAGRLGNSCESSDGRPPARDPQSSDRKEESPAM